MTGSGERFAQGAQDPRRGSGIVGIGGLNVDYIVSASGLRESIAQADRVVFDAAIVPGSEAAIDEALFARLRKAIPPQFVQARPGGSSFNAVRALRRLSPSVRLGFVGAAGFDGEGRRLREVLASAEIAHEHVVFAEGREPGSCLAIENEGERHLLTARAANDCLAGHIETSAGLAEWLAGFRVLHVSSLLDDRTPGVLVRLVERARQINRDLVFSLDPGMPWASKASDPHVGKLLAASDLLFLNPEEGRMLEAAGALERVTATLFRKSPDRITTYGRAVHDGSISLQELPVARLPDSDIRDPTGAGDVFAAGVLSVLHDHPADTLEAARAGIAAARRKLLALDFQGS